jgi:uncharacterized protein (TIGR02246 family)
MMLRKLLLAGCLEVVSLMVACNKPVVPDTGEADIKAVKELETAWAKDIAAKDADKAASYSAVDGSLLFPNAPVITGRDNIKATWTMVFSDPNYALAFQSTKADVSKSGDLAYTVGTYSMTMTNPIEKKPVTDRGKYLTVFKKQPDGNWKAVADMANSDLPLRGAAK